MAASFIEVADLNTAKRLSRWMMKDSRMKDDPANGTTNAVSVVQHPTLRKVALSFPEDFKVRLARRASIERLEKEVGKQKEVDKAELTTNIAKRRETKASVSQILPPGVRTRSFDEATAIAEGWIGSLS